MPIDVARRIMALGGAANVTDEKIRKAEELCDDADVKKALDVLNTIANKRGVTIEELIAAYE